MRAQEALAVVQYHRVPLKPLGGKVVTMTTLEQASTGQTDQERCAIYVRISDDQSGEEAGVERQLESGLTLAKLKGWRVVKTYTDNDLSATDPKVFRPAYDQMLKDIERGLFAKVVTWNADRMQRTMPDLMRLIEVGAPVSLNIQAVKGSSFDLGSSDGVMVAEILTSVAHKEVKHKAERQKAANIARARGGKSNRSNRCYGYEKDGTIRESEARYVREIFRRYNAGHALSVLVAYLGNEGQVSANSQYKSSKGWTRAGLRIMLRNRRYLGDITYHGEVVANGAPAIIDAGTFDAANHRLSEAAKDRPKGGSRRKYLGSGLFRCGVCGGIMFSHHGNGKIHYVCPGHVHRTAEPIDIVVIDAIVQRLQTDEVRQQFATDDDTTQALALRSEIMALNLKLERYLRDYGDGELTAVEKNKLSKPVHDQLMRANRQLADLGRSSAMAEIMGAHDPGKAWLEHPDIRVRARIVDELLTVTLHRHRRGAPFTLESVTIEPKGVDTVTP